MRRETPSDGRGGIGATYVVEDTLISEKPKVRLANARDISTSAGTIRPGDWIASKITPRDDANTVGTALSTLSTRPASPGQRCYVVLAGPDLTSYVPANPSAMPPVQASGGGHFTLEGVDASKNFELVLTLRPVSGRL